MESESLLGKYRVTRRALPQEWKVQSGRTCLWALLPRVQHKAACAGTITGIITPIRLLLLDLFSQHFNSTITRFTINPSNKATPRKFQHG